MAHVHSSTSPHTCRRSHARLQLAVPQRRDVKDEVDDDEDEPQRRVGCPPQDKAQVCPKKFLARASFGSTISGWQMTGEGKALTGRKTCRAPLAAGWKTIALSLSLFGLQLNLILVCGQEMYPRSAKRDGRQ